MITLNSEKGLVKIESWDDILSRPGFTVNIDPKTVKLQSIIGSYTFDSHLPCGLSTCHQPHGKGYLITTQDGRETNIGCICGKKHFSVDFVQMRRAFIRDLNNQQRREHLWTLKHRLPSINQEISALKNHPNGASWVYSHVSQLIGNSGSLPRSVTNIVREMARKGNGALVIQRMRTKEEREVSAASSEIAGLQRRSANDLYVQEVVGQLEGFGSLATENNLRAILTETLEPFIFALAASDIDTLPSKELGALYRVGSDFDRLVERLRSALSQGRRLLRKSNIEQLLQYTTNQPEKRAMQLFSNVLPSEA